MAPLMTDFDEGLANGERAEVCASMGDVLAVDDPDRGWVADSCGR